MRISYLNVQVSQHSHDLDVVSKQRVVDDVENELAIARNVKLREELARKTEEAEALRREAEIAKIKAKNDADLARIQHERDLEEQRNIIELKRKEVAAEKEYALEQVENDAAIAAEYKKLREANDMEDLVVTRPEFQRYIDLEQEKVDRKRDNMRKDLELQQQQLEAFMEFASRMPDVDPAIVNQFLLHTLRPGGEMLRLEAPPPKNDDDVIDVGGPDIVEGGANV